MTLPVALREQIRRRARFTCEFCGIGESDAGGPLTIDHFRPKAKDGSDHPDNLVYCCVRSIERDRLLGHYREVTQLLEMVLREQARLMEDQQRLLEEQRLLLQLLIDRNR